MSYTFCEKKVGEKLHELRMRKKVEAAEAADEMHISREHYSRIENGTRRISLEMLFILMNLWRGCEYHLMYKGWRIRRMRRLERIWSLKKYILEY